MISDKTIQLLRILKWQAFVVSGQDIDKMEAKFQCRGIFHKFECSCKDCVEAFNFCVEIKKRCKILQRMQRNNKIYIYFGCSFLVLFI